MTSCGKCDPAISDLCHGARGEGTRCQFFSSRFTRDSFLDEIQPIVAPEHFAVHEERRQPERAAADRFVAVGAQSILDFVAVDLRRLESRPLEYQPQRVLLAEVLASFPNRAKRRRMELAKPSMNLRRDSTAQHPDCVERKMRTECGGQSVTLRPALEFDDVVMPFALNHERPAVAGGLHYRAEKRGPINNLSSSPSGNRRQLRIGQIAEGTEVVIKELDFSGHRYLPENTPIQAVSLCN